MRKSSIQNLNTRLAVHKLFTKTIRQKVFLRDIFDLYTKGFMHSDKAFVKLLTMATIRHLGQIDDILVRYVVRKPSKIVEDILRIGIAQILFLRK